MEELPDGPVLPASEPAGSDEVVLRPPRTLRHLAYTQAGAGVLLILIAVYAFWIQALMPAMCIAFMGLVLVGATLNVLMGKVKFGPDGLHNHEDLVSQSYMAWDGIKALQRRRGLFTESVVAVSPVTSVTLAAPMRLRFRRDSGFDAALAALSQRSGIEITRGRSRLTVRYVLTHLVVLAVWTSLFVKFDPIWHHSAWPGHEEAQRLPNACNVIEPTAKELFPKASPLRRPYGGTEECEFGDSLSLRYRLFEYALGHDGGIEQAMDSFDEGPRRRAPVVRGIRKLPGVGDEATVTTALHRDGVLVNQIKVSARKANVVVQLVYSPPEGRDSKDAAVPEAERLARAAVAAIDVE